MRVGGAEVVDAYLFLSSLLYFTLKSLKAKISRLSNATIAI
jgi:hypothetical protein